jgi:hypothetical protein
MLISIGRIAVYVDKILGILAPALMTWPRRSERTLAVLMTLIIDFENLHRKLV